MSITRKAILDDLRERGHHASDVLPAVINDVVAKIAGLPSGSHERNVLFGDMLRMINDQHELCGAALEFLQMPSGVIRISWGLVYTEDGEGYLIPPQAAAGDHDRLILMVCGPKTHVLASKKDPGDRLVKNDDRTLFHKLAPQEISSIEWSSIQPGDGGALILFRLKQSFKLLTGPVYILALQKDATSKDWSEDLLHVIGLLGKGLTITM